MKKLVSLLLLLVFVLAISSCKEKVDFSEPTDLGEKLFEQIFTEEEYMSFQALTKYMPHPICRPEDSIVMLTILKFLTASQQDILWI